MGFLKKYPYIFYFSLCYNNGSETAVYIFLGQKETAPSTFSAFEESLPAVWAGFFYVLLRHEKNEEL